MRPVVPPPSEFLERIKSATKHMGVGKGQKKAEPKQSGDDDWHLSLPDTSDPAAAACSPEEIPRLDSGGANLDDLSELADIADRVVKNMTERKSAGKSVAEEDFGKSYCLKFFYGERLNDYEVLDFCQFQGLISMI